MRLKTFFFPIILVISISIFIGYIWPEIMEVKKINEFKLAKNNELNELGLKKNAVEMVGKQISNTDSEKVIKDYLPENKTEERIISGISYLASDANVSLIDISLSGEKNANKKVEAPIGLAGVLNPLARAESGVDNTGSDLTINGPAKSPAQSEVQTTTANISISGDYEKIRIFLGSLQRMSIFNTIKSLKISKQQGSEAEGEVVSGDNTLMANLTVDFGYFNVAKVDGQKVASFKSEIDNETVDILKQYVSQKTQSFEIGGDVTGKTNPFIAN